MLTLVTPHHSDLDGLAALLASVARERARGDAPQLEMIVVDDASPAGVEGLRQIIEPHPWVRLLVHSENQGPAAARNYGAQAGEAPWLWFLDADVTLEPGALRAMADLLSERPDLDAVVCGVGPRCVGGTSFQRYKNYLEHAWQPPEGPTGTLDSKSVVLRRKVFEALGGFDAAIPDAGVEDYELGYRLRATGAQIHFTHRVRITHRHAPLPRQARIFHRRACDWVRLKARHGSGFDDYGTSRRQAVAELASLGVAASALGSVLVPPLLLTLPGLVAAQVLLEAPMHREAARAGEGPGFHVRCVAYSAMLSLPVVTGVGRGLLDRRYAP